MSHSLSPTKASQLVLVTCRVACKHQTGTNGVSTNGVTAIFVFLTEGLLGTPINLLLSPQLPGPTFFPNLSKIVTFAAPPSVLTPFVRNGNRRSPPGWRATAPSQSSLRCSRPWGSGGKAAPRTLQLCSQTHDYDYISTHLCGSPSAGWLFEEALHVRDGQRTAEAPNTNWTKMISK